MAIIRRQRVNPEKLEKAKELRQHMTAAEKILWDHLRGNQLNGLHFRRQQVIDGYIVDFYCHSARLIVEVDGSIHDNQMDEDQKRDSILQSKRLKVLRVKNEEIHTDLSNALNNITQACGK